MFFISVKFVKFEFHLVEFLFILAPTFNKNSCFSSHISLFTRTKNTIFIFFGRTKKNKNVRDENQILSIF